MIKSTLMRIYTFFAALLVRAIVKYCTARGRYVDYVHSEPHCARDQVIERVYMRRYVITGFMTGDAHPNSLLSLNHGPGLLGRVRRTWGEARRWWALNRWHLYLHHMHAPDADECLHDHPWPWGLSFILLGGYLEQRSYPDGLVQSGTGSRWLRAPALNRLRGTTFHRISELDKHLIRSKRIHGGFMKGTWTLFLAGPRSKSKPWGYLVPGRGFVPQRERHQEMGASERRAGQ